MLWKLQRKTLLPVQILGYAFTLFIGVAIILITIQFYLDLQPLLVKNTELFNKNTAVLSKQVSIVHALDGEAVDSKKTVYFTSNEIRELEEQPFIRKVALFNHARFQIRVEIDQQQMGRIGTELFFESIPDEYLDVKPESWKWDQKSNFIPIIIPEDYLQLYNFGYAQSKGLPVISKLMATSAPLKIWIEGRSKPFSGNIVGFSNKINSILVPQDFLNWANESYGISRQSSASRLLIEFTDPTDERIMRFFKARDYFINEDRLEFSKLVFIFKSALAFIFFIALTIVVLSFAFILLSINLMFEKHKETILNLYYIGYGNKQIARFYQIVISSFTGISLIAASLAGLVIRNYYVNKVINNFFIEVNRNWILLLGVIILVVLLSLYNILVVRSIRRINNPANT
ncbi:MAG: hypothetical protein JW801_09765 [Bacteroidales bacterium]|nr:hypothetical protein [Bacteroidales bacterium]